MRRRMTSLVEKHFLRVFMFAHKITQPVVREFFSATVLNQNRYDKDFRKFLEVNRHEIYHLWETTKCCECDSSDVRKNGSLKINGEQFRLLYSTGNPDYSHVKKKRNGEISQYCVCCIVVHPDISLEKLDITLLNSLIKRCCSLQTQDEHWLDTIRKMRNILCHVADISSLTQNDINAMRQKLEGAVLGLASEISSPAYEKSIRLQIDFLMMAEVVPDYVQPFMVAMKNEFDEKLNDVLECEKAMQEFLGTILEHQKEEILHGQAEIQEELQNIATQGLGKLEEQLVLTQKATEATKNDTEKILKDQQESGGEMETFKTNMKEGIDTILEKIDKLTVAVELPQSITIQKMLETDSTDKVVISERNEAGSRATELVIDEDAGSSTGCSLVGPFSKSESLAAVGSSPKQFLLELKINTPGSLEEEKPKLISTLKHAANMVEMWAPYKIKWVEKGCISIGAEVSADVLTDNTSFRESVKKLLRTIVHESGIDTTKSLTIKAKVNFIGNPEESRADHLYTREKSDSGQNKSQETEHDLSDPSHGQVDSRDSAGVTKIGRALSVSQTRRYHADGTGFDIMFINLDCQKQADWVLRVVRRLEIDYKFFCGIPGRDFLFGIPTADSFRPFIENSINVVLVVSEDSNKTDCSNTYRLLYGFRSVIVVMVEHCSIPLQLRSMKCVDATQKETIWFQQFLQAIDDLGVEKLIPQTSSGYETGVEKLIPQTSSDYETGVEMFIQSSSSGYETE